MEVCFHQNNSKIYIVSLTFARKTTNFSMLAAWSHGEIIVVPLDDPPLSPQTNNYRIS